MHKANDQLDTINECEAHVVEPSLINDFDLKIIGESLDLD